MITFPVLETERLVLNQPVEEDLQAIVIHLNETSEFAENTLTMPFPYSENDGRNWLKIIEKGFEEKNAYIFGVRLKNNLKLIGAVGLHLVAEHNKAEIGYWLAKEFWNQGIISEAVEKVIHFGFKELQLNKIYASFYPHNPASGKIMQKCGMRKEGYLPQEILKNGRFLDLTRYSILKTDFQDF